jgi:hypothetical protein
MKVFIECHGLRENMNKILTSGIFLCFMVFTSWALADVPQKDLAQSFIIESSPETKKINVGGNWDETRFLWPNMPAKKRFFSRIRITNDGDQNVINPRVRINGFQTPLSSDELIQNISHGGHDPLDRVLRTFHAIRYYSMHASPETETAEPLSYFLFRSYGLCQNQTAVQAGLWELFGYKWRDSGPHNHMSAEVDINGKTVHLDTDLHAYYLMYDNMTIASAQDIHDDPMLVIRSSHERVSDRFPRMPDDPEVNMYFSSERYAAQYWPRGSTPPLTLGKPVKESVRIVLRPGESYGWHTGERKAVNPFNNDPNIPIVARDVLWETRLDMANKAHLWFLSDKTEKGKIQDVGAFDFKRKIITISYKLPFPLLGMKIHLIPASVGDADRLDLNEKVRVRIITHEKTMEEYVALKEIIKGEYSLDHLVQKMSFPLREFRIEIDGRKLLLNNHENFSLSSINVSLNCLSTIFALRALQAGENTLVYSDDSSIRSIKIIAEASQGHTMLPRFPNDSCYPSANAETPESNLQFMWPEAIGASVAGYHIQISAFPDMRYPLSPTFDRLVQGDQMSIVGGMVRFRLPWHGMLPVQTKLYWRVRPFNNDLLAGDWSQTASFKVQGPGAPELIKLTEQDGKIILSWKAAAYGTAPAYYEIHASNLEGFMPVDKQHRLLGLSNHDVNKRCWDGICSTSWPLVPSTFIMSTKKTEIVLIPSGTKNLKKRLGAHWRVIAVDAKGSRSCPSPQGFLRTPMLVPPDIIMFPPGKVTYQVPVISTLGRVWIKENYDMGLWSKPKITFSLAPSSSQNWKIDKTKGLIKGTLKANEEISLQVSAQDQYGRKDAKVLRFRTGGR